MTFQTPGLKRQSRIAALACVVLAIMLPLYLVWLGLFGTGEVDFLSRFAASEADRPTGVQRLAMLIVALLPSLAFSRSLFAAAGCFRGIEKGDWFAPQQSVALITTGKWFVISGLLGALTPSLLSLLQSLTAAPGERIFAISLSSTAFTALIFGSLVWMLGHLWTRARALADENAAFV